MRRRGSNACGAPKEKGGPNVLALFTVVFFVPDAAVHGALCGWGGKKARQRGGDRQWGRKKWRRVFGCFALCCLLLLPLLWMVERSVKTTPPQRQQHVLPPKTRIKGFLVSNICAESWGSSCPRILSNYLRLRRPLTMS